MDLLSQLIIQVGTIWLMRLPKYVMVQGGGGVHKGYVAVSVIWSSLLLWVSFQQENSYLMSVLGL